MKTLRLATVFAAAGSGVVIGWTSLFVASFMASKSEYGIGLGLKRDGVS